jgi:hypothetical protein
MKGEKVSSDSEPTPGGPRQSASKSLNGNIEETRHSQAAATALGMSLDVRALVSQEHESSIYLQFRSPLGNIVTPILLDESLSGLWTESCLELLELCGRCPLPLTYNKNIILNHHTCRKPLHLGPGSPDN